MTCVLFLCCMCVWCEGVGHAGVGGVAVVSAGHQCVGGTHGSGIVSSAADVLEMSVLRGMRGVGGACEMGMCLSRGGVGWVSG